jgi:L-alanine-DL-glutamate epimerase-like enolase superfamily enzyme
VTAGRGTTSRPRLRITDVETIPLRIPFRHALTESVGRYEEITPVLVKLHTDGGVTGIGEVESYPLYERDGVEPQAGVLAILRSHFTPLLTGSDAFQIERLWARMEEQVKGHLWVKAGIDLALHDLMGKALEVPVYDLLGGACRRRHPVEGVGFGISLEAPERVAAIAARAVAQGFVELELKAGDPDPRRDVERVRLTREAIGREVPIKIDVNRGYDVRTAIRVITAMEEFGIELVEQPIAAWDLDGLAMVRRAIRTPLVVDESVSTVHDLMAVIRHGAADGVHIKPTVKGGLTTARRLAALAEAAGLLIIPGTNLPTGVGMGAVHAFVAATREVHRGIHGSPLDALADDIVRAPIPKDTTWVEIGDGPGLGFELDEDKVVRYRVAT